MSQVHLYRGCTCRSCTTGAEDTLQQGGCSESKFYSPNLDLFTAISWTYVALAAQPVDSSGVAYIPDPGRDKVVI